MSTEAPATPQSQNQARCRGCGYSLADLREHACPECGRAFDPAEPRTFVSGPAALSWLAALAPPRTIFVLYALLAALLTLTWTAPDGRCSDVCVFLIMPFAGLSALAWGLPFAAHLAGRVGLVLHGCRQPRWRWRWLVVPLSFAAFYGSVTTGALWDVRWALASGSFARLAARPPAEVAPGWVGGFRVVEAEARPDGTLCLTLGFPDVYSDGPPLLIYSPGVAPTTYLRPIVKDIGGGWWVLVDPT